MARAWIIAGALALAAHAPARAQTSLPLTLQWHAPPECASEADARAELARITRVRPGFELAAVSAQVRIERSAKGYSLLLRSSRDGRAGERRLHAADCTTAVRTATLVLALAFGPGVEIVRDGPAAADDARGAHQQPVAPAQDARRDARPDGRSRRQSRGDAAEEDARDAAPRQPGAPSGDASAFSLDAALLAGGGAQLGLLPAAAFALTAGAELSAGAARLSLRATALPGVSEDLQQGVGARFDSLGAVLSGCGDLWRARWTLALCASARAAALRGRSARASENGSETAAWYALAPAAAVTWPGARLLSVRLEAAAGLSLNRPRFVVEGLGVAHRVPALFAELALMLVVDP